MAIALQVTPGKRFQTGEKVTNAKLNLLGTPTISFEGLFGPTDMTAGDYSALLAAGAYFYGVDTGVTNVAVVQLGVNFNAYLDGLSVVFKVKNANTGPVTLNVNGLGAQPVLKNATLPLSAGDWVPGQIVEVRYRLDPNQVPPTAVYSASGSFVLPLVVGQIYTWTPSVNDTSLVCGATTLTTTGQFTATVASANLTGADNTGVTATVIPASNVWQMESQVANVPAQVSAFGGATAYMAGMIGFVPPPKAGEQGKYLRADGTWVDVVAQLQAVIPAQLFYQEIWKAMSFE